MAVLLHAKRELLTLEAPPVAGLYAGVVLPVGVTCVALRGGIRHATRRPACASGAWSGFAAANPLRG
jgi:hypothetical protein